MTNQDVTRIAKELQLEHSGRLDLVYFHGETMLPFLQEGDELIVQPVDGNDIVPGDIVTYREELKFPTRRVVEVQKDTRQLIIKADHKPPQRFYLVPESDVLGKVVARKRGNDWIFSDDAAWLEVACDALNKAQEILKSRKDRALRAKTSSSTSGFRKRWLRLLRTRHRRKDSP